MSDRVDFAVAKNDFNICRFRVVSVDPEKYTGPIYHYSWLPYAWLQSHHSPFGKADNFIISFQGYKHAPSTETINIEKESIVTTWILNPWVPPLSYYNAWPTKKVNSFSKTYFAEWTRPVSLDPSFMPDGSMGGTETRFAIVPSKNKYGPVATHMMISPQWNITHPSPDRTAVDLGVKADISLVVYGKNSWGQTMTINDGWDAFHSSLDQAFADLDDTYNKRSTLKDTTAPFWYNPSYWEHGTKVLNIPCLEKQLISQDFDLQPPRPTITLRGLPVFPIDACAEPGDQMALSIRLKRPPETSWGTEPPTNIGGVIEENWDWLDQNSSISFFDDQNDNGIGEPDERISPYAERTFQDLRRFLIEVDQQKIVSRINHEAQLHLSKNPAKCNQLVLDFVCQIVTINKSGLIPNRKSAHDLSIGLVPK